MRREKVPTATVSICVTHDEAELIRDAATVAGMPVSAWAAARTAVALSNPAARREVGKHAAKLAAAPPIRGARNARISMVMRQGDHEALKSTAGSFDLTAHAFAQACLLLAAETELKDLPAPVRRVADEQRRASRMAGLTLVTAPRWAAGLDLDAVAELVRELLYGTLGAILDGKGRTIAAGMQKLAAAHADDLVTLKLRLSEADLRAVALVLGIQPEIVATALTLKAAKAAQKLAAA